MKTIDLSQNIYFNDFEFSYYGNYYGSIEYKVTNLTKDKYVYFTNLDISINFLTYYYPYYPGESLFPLEPVYHPNFTVFEVLNINTGESTKFVRLFKFEKNTEYIIKIHCFVYYNDYYYKSKTYY